MSEEIEKVDKKDGLQKEIQNSELIIREAEGVLELWDRIAPEDGQREKVTGMAGGVLGATANTLIDAKVEQDPEKRAKKLEIGANSIMEMTRSFVGVLLAGNRRRMNKDKIDGKAEVVEEQTGEVEKA